MGQSCTKGGVEEAELLRAAKEGETSIVSQLLLKHVSWTFSVQNWSGQSVWHLASRYGRQEVMRALIDCVRYSPSGPDQWKPLLRLGHSSDAIIKALANHQDIRLQTPLHLACMYGHAECAKLLLSLGASPWMGDELGGRTPLHYAAAMGHVDCIAALLAEPVPNPGMTVLRLPNKERTRLVDVLNDCGYTPLHYAVWSASLDAMRALLSYDANLCAKNIASGSAADWVQSGLKFTPLHLAAWKGNAECVQLLLTAYVHSTSGNAGSTSRRRDPRRQMNAARQLPYHIAIARHHNELCEALHPDVPYSFIIGSGQGEDGGANAARLFGPPKLALIAANALQKKLLDEICAAEVLFAKEGPPIAHSRGPSVSGNSCLMQPIVVLGRAPSASPGSNAGSLAAAASLAEAAAFFASEAKAPADDTAAVSSYRRSKSGQWRQRRQQQPSTSQISPPPGPASNNGSAHARPISTSGITRGFSTSGSFRGGVAGGSLATANGEARSAAAINRASTLSSHVNNMDFRTGGDDDVDGGRGPSPSGSPTQREPLLTTSAPFAGSTPLELALIDASSSLATSFSLRMSSAAQPSLRSQSALQNAPPAAAAAVSATALGASPFASFRFAADAVCPPAINSNTMAPIAAAAGAVAGVGVGSVGARSTNPGTLALTLPTHSQPLPSTNSHNTVPPLRYNAAYSNGGAAASGSAAAGSQAAGSEARGGTGSSPPSVLRHSETLQDEVVLRNYRLLQLALGVPTKGVDLSGSVNRVLSSPDGEGGVPGLSAAGLHKARISNSSSCTNMTTAAASPSPSPPNGLLRALSSSPLPPLVSSGGGHHAVGTAGTGMSGTGTTGLAEDRAMAAGAATPPIFNPTLSPFQQLSRMHPVANSFAPVNATAAASNGFAVSPSRPTSAVSLPTSVDRRLTWDGVRMNQMRNIEEHGEHSGNGALQTLGGSLMLRLSPPCLHDSSTEAEHSDDDSEFEGPVVPLSPCASQHGHATITEREDGETDALLLRDSTRPQSLALPGMPLSTQASVSNSPGGFAGLLQAAAMLPAAAAGGLGIALNLSRVSRSSFEAGTSANNSHRHRRVTTDGNGGLTPPAGAGGGNARTPRGAGTTPRGAGGSTITNSLLDTIESSTNLNGSGCENGGNGGRFAIGGCGREQRGVHARSMSAAQQQQQPLLSSHMSLAIPYATSNTQNSNVGIVAGLLALDRSMTVAPLARTGEALRVSNFWGGGAAAVSMNGGGEVVAGSAERQNVNVSASGVPGSLLGERSTQGMRQRLASGSLAGAGHSRKPSEQQQVLETLMRGMSGLLAKAAASEAGDASVCGVCLDMPDVLQLQGCNHRLCMQCSKELCKLHHFKPALCPFCRRTIMGFQLMMS